MLLFGVPLLSQTNYTLHILPTDTTAEFIRKAVKIKAQAPDSLSAVQELRRIILDLQGQAYLEASIDTLVRKDSVLVAFLHLGKPYRWARLRSGNAEEVLLSQVGFRERLYRGKPFSYREVQKLLESLLTYLENNGYPFAQVRLDSIDIQGQTLEAALHLEKNSFVLIDKIEIGGGVTISKTYLSNYLGIQEGEPYDRSKVLRIRDRLRELPFLSARTDPTITFRGDRATLNLNLEKKRASKFDFLIGVLPNSQQAGKLLITGTFNGEMQNQFGIGERLYAEFEQLRPQTQQLVLQFNYPYVLDLPFGIDLAFDLYKRDTNYITIEYDLGLQYLLEGGDYLKAFWNNRTTNLLKIDSAQIIRSGNLPDTLDINNATFGLEYARQDVDYRFNPRKGWSSVLRAGAGTKRIKRNNDIDQLEIGDLYQGIKLKSFQYRVEGQVAAYFPFFSRSTLKAGLQGGVIISEEPIYANEQYRIGGNRLLRGFDEESIFATNYGVLTLEYRLLLGLNSYLYVFGDYARVDAATAKTEPGMKTVDFPYSFGAGITFETKVGLFGISLAVGSQKDNPIDFGAPKVHFGYVSFF